MFYWQHVGKEWVHMCFKAEERGHRQDCFSTLPQCHKVHDHVHHSSEISSVVPVFSYCTEKHNLGSIHA